MATFGEWHWKMEERCETRVRATCQKVFATDQGSNLGDGSGVGETALDRRVLKKGN